MVGHGGTSLEEVRCCLIVPDAVGMIKTEKVGMKCG